MAPYSQTSTYLQAQVLRLVLDPSPVHTQRLLIVIALNTAHIMGRAVHQTIHQSRTLRPDPSTCSERGLFSAVR